jgi:hypothetical protein
VSIYNIPQPLVKVVAIIRLAMYRDVYEHYLGRAIVINPPMR